MDAGRLRRDAVLDRVGHAYARVRHVEDDRRFAEQLDADCFGDRQLRVRAAGRPLGPQADVKCQHFDLLGIYVRLRIFHRSH